MIYLFTPALMDNYGNLSTNLGDLMIHEAVVRELSGLFPEVQIIGISSHKSIKNLKLSINKNDFCFVGGSNLLSSNMNEYAQWEIGLKDIFKIKNAVLFGVGWWQYQNHPNFYTRMLLRNILSRKIIHSVRDNYTANMLRNIGFDNVINTHCPTMWPLLNKDLDIIPKKKSSNVLVMITDYKKAPKHDKALFELVSRIYKNVFFWPQGTKDLDYFYSLSIDDPIKIIGRSIKDLDNLLESDINLDYVGTRLHGGIRCILNNRRSLILEVDNRAKEISKDTGLPSVERSDYDLIESWIQSNTSIDVKLNKNAIESWKAQFQA